MCDPRTVIEGSLKYRDGRKWKSRWCVVSKLSPVADCIHVQLYRDSKERCKQGPTKASLSLAGCLGLESGFTLDKESHTMALICPDLVLALAFDSRELLIQWQVKIRSNVAEGEGLHVLHTNQAEELAEAFEAASRGKLAARRKLPCKASATETPSRMSLQPRSRAQESSQCSSSESRRPLLSSGCSDVGSCDACFEIVRFASDAPTPDDFFRSRTFCKVHYRGGPAPSVSSSDAESADTVSLTISDIQEPLGTKETADNQVSSPLPVSGSAPAVWTYTHCGKCGRHYCARCSFPSQSGRSPDGSRWFPPAMDSGPQDAPTAGMDDRRSRTREVARHHRLLQPTSQWCGVSIEFPRRTIRVFDRPPVRRRLLWWTPCCREFMASAVHLASAAHVAFSRAPKPLWRAPVPPTHRLRRRNVLRRSRGPPCTCNVRLQYPNYDVPRAALANLYLKEQSKSAADITPDLPSSDTNMDATMHYDVPKKYKEHVSQESSQGTRAARLPLACSCGNSLVPDPLSMCQELNACSHVRAACTCNRVTFWAGNLVPCFQRAPSEENQAATLQCPKSYAPSTICREPGKRNRILGTMPDSKKLDHCSDYVNCHFIESLPLYQNTCALSSVSEQCDSDKDAKSTEKKTIIPGSPSVNQSQFKSPEKSATLKKTGPRASPSSSTIGESYEMMSFRGSSEQVSVVCDSNYIAMRPIEPCKCDNERGGSNVTSSDTKRTPLPLRPFMPYLLPCEEEFPEDVSSEAETSWKNSTKCSLVSSRQRSTETPDKPSPLADAKRKVLTKKRSSSADGRQETEEMSEAEETVPMGRERRPTFNKLPFRARSQNLVDVTPPSSVPSTPNNRSMENLYRIPFHRSADCLKLKGDFRFSEEDLSMDARNLDEGTTVSHRRCDESKRFIQEAFARCPQQGAFGLPGERYAAALKGSSESSTTSSDSDYIETLSLCSSGSNGSGSEYLRCEDIAAGRPCPVSCGLKPRSAKEYNAIDRSAIRHEMHEEGVCGAVLHTCHQRTHHHAPIHLTLPKAARSTPPPSPVQGQGTRASAAKPSPAAS
ncbi:hypothetical protein MTO96_009734 [Rhipicephalus appendiculatus]